MQKKNLMRTLYILLLFAILFIGIALINRVLFGGDKWDLFYQMDKDTIDVAHFGSSHSFCGSVAVLESEMLNADVFNFSRGDTSIEQIKYTLIEVLKTQHPKIVTIELYSLREWPSSGAMHMNFDAMRMSRNKVDAIKYNIKKNRLDYYIPLINQHLKWSTEDIFPNIKRLFINHDWADFQYGSYMLSKHYSPSEDEQFVPNVEVSEVSALPKARLDLLNDIIDICNENDIQLIFIVMPYVNNKYYSPAALQADINGLESLIHENNIDLIDYMALTSKTGITYADLADRDHLNIAGAYKASEYFSHYVSAKYSALLSDATWDYKADMRIKKEKYDQALDCFIN